VTRPATSLSQAILVMVVLVAAGAWVSWHDRRRATRQGLSYWDWTDVPALPPRRTEHLPVASMAASGTGGAATGAPGLGEQADAIPGEDTAGSHRAAAIVPSSARQRIPAPRQAPGQLTDNELIIQVREGVTAAYATLYTRHAIAAFALARQLARPATEADDLVSEAFARVLAILRRGQGPDAAFRPYLLTTLRRVAYDRTHHDRMLEFSADAGAQAAHRPAGTEFHDAALASLERSLAVRALSRLPERWRAVLWHTEIDDASPADIAPLFGLTPNGVAALAYRARERLRQAYLQEHLAEPVGEGCRPAAGKLGAWVRGGLGKRNTARVHAHLSTCGRCRELAAELADVNVSLNRATGRNDQTRAADLT